MLVLAKPKLSLREKGRRDEEEEEAKPIFVHLKLILLCTHVNTFSMSVRISVLVRVLCSKIRPHNAIQ